jgi:hypothetical protein
MIALPSHPRALRHRATALAALLVAGAGVLAARADEVPAAGNCGVSHNASSAEAAFQAAFIDSGLGLRGYRENREYAAAIYQMPDGSWHCTSVVPGTRLESRIPYHEVPDVAVRIVGAHTHGQPRVPEDPQGLYGTDFSASDRRNAVHNYRASEGRIDTQLLLSSEFRILRLDLRGTVIPDSAQFSPAGITRLRVEVLSARALDPGAVTLAARANR